MKSGGYDLIYAYGKWVMSNSYGDMIIFDEYKDAVHALNVCIGGAFFLGAKPVFLSQVKSRG